MTRVVIVARTRMHGDRVCIGGYDLDRGFRSVRLLDRFGDHFSRDAAFQVGEIWTMRYWERISIQPPHVEDVFVMEYERAGSVDDLAGLVLRHVRPWEDGKLFEGTVRRAPSNAGYIPRAGPLPRCSTGYWAPSRVLERQDFGRIVRFVGEGRRLPWVGTASPPQRIEPGSVVRVSLSHLFVSEAAPEGYYVQISGVLKAGE